jgi:hypothetical protein
MTVTTAYDTTAESPELVEQPKKGKPMTTETSGRQTAALVLGIIGGVFGIIAAVIAMAVGGIGAAVGAEGGDMVIGLGFAAVFIATAGIVGGALAKSRPKVAFWLMLATGLGGFIAISGAWLISGPLLLVGAFLARSGILRPVES